MSWSQFLDHWSVGSRLLTDAFRYLDRDAIARFRGDRSRLVAYIAASHDLTVAEAREALDDWLMLAAPRRLERLAA